MYVGNEVKQNFSSTNFDNSLRYLPPGESLDAGTLVDCDIETISSLISDELSDEQTSHLLHCGLSNNSYKNVKSLVEERAGNHIKLLSSYVSYKSRLPMETSSASAKLSASRLLSKLAAACAAKSSAMSRCWKNGRP